MVCLAKLKAVLSSLTATGKELTGTYWNLSCTHSCLSKCYNAEDFLYQKQAAMSL